MPDREEEWLLSRPPVTSPRATLVCFPAAGAGASSYSGWRRLLPADIHLLAVQLPGRESRLDEAPLCDADEIVRRVGPAIAAIAGPLVIFGHSMGAVLAFETTRWLRSRGRDVAALVASARVPPDQPLSVPPLHLLSDADLVRELQRLDENQAAALADPELASLFMPALRADLTVNETYRYSASRYSASGYSASGQLDVPILSLSGRGDPVCSASDMEAWARHTSAGFCHQAFPGGHFFVRERPEQVLAVLAAECNAAASRAGVAPAWPLAAAEPHFPLGQG